MNRMSRYLVVLLAFGLGLYKDVHAKEEMKLLFVETTKMGEKFDDDKGMTSDLLSELKTRFKEETEQEYDIAFEEVPNFLWYQLLHAGLESSILENPEHDYLLEWDLSRGAHELVSINIKLSKSRGDEDPKIWKKKFRRDVDRTAYWFRTLGLQGSAYLKGTVIKDDVFTYCFKALRSIKDHDVERFRVALPGYLKGWLKEHGFDKKYILQTLDKAQMEEECGSAGQNIYESTGFLFLHKYSVSGDMAVESETDKSYKVALEIVVNEDDGTQVSWPAFNYTGSFDSEFINELGRTILEKWNEKAKE